MRWPKISGSNWKYSFENKTRFSDIWYRLEKKNLWIRCANLIFSFKMATITIRPTLDLLCCFAYNGHRHKIYKRIEIWLWIVICKQLHIMQQWTTNTKCSMLNPVCWQWHRAAADSVNNKSERILSDCWFHLNGYWLLATGCWLVFQILIKIWK